MKTCFKAQHIYISLTLPKALLVEYTSLKYSALESEKEKFTALEQIETSTEFLVRLLAGALLGVSIMSKTHLCSDIMIWRKTVWSLGVGT